MSGNNKIFKIALTVIVIGLIGLSGIKIGNHIKEEKEKKIEAQALKEKKRKEEEEKKKQIIGVGPNGKAYADDAVEVSKKLSKYDFENGGKKVVYLTFDDGTSTTNTPSVLKTLKEEGVRATFFTTGSNILKGGDKAKELLREELKEGHAIANHSFSHDYNILYPKVDGKHRLNLDSFLADFKKQDDILKEALGPYFSTRVIRCPGGHMSWRGMDKLDEYLEKNKMASIDWNAIDGDAEGKKKNAAELLQMAIDTSKNKNMVVLLMHDTYGKEETAKALPDIIKHFKDSGYEFRTLA